MDGDGGLSGYSVLSLLCNEVRRDVGTKMSIVFLPEPFWYLLTLSLVSSTVLLLQHLF